MSIQCRPTWNTLYIKDKKYQHLDNCASVWSLQVVSKIHSSTITCLVSSCEFTLNLSVTRSKRLKILIYAVELYVHFLLHPFFSDTRLHEHIKHILRVHHFGLLSPVSFNLLSDVDLTSVWSFLRLKIPTWWKLHLWFGSSLSMRPKSLQTAIILLNCDEAA